MKRVLVLFVATFLAIGFQAATSAAQGLAERRAIKEYEEGKFAQLKKDIQTAAGFEVSILVDWTKIALPGQADSYKEDGYWTNIYFTPLIGALKGITKDEMGKAALKEKLKEIKVTYDESTAPASNYANGLSFDSGKLTINFAPWSNADDISDRQEAMQKLLEQHL